MTERAKGRAEPTRGRDGRAVGDRCGELTESDRRGVALHERDCFTRAGYARRRPGDHTEPDEAIDRLADTDALFAPQALDLGHDIIVQGKRRPHATTLAF